MTFFTFHSNKGGVGKTTITLNIADALAKQNKKVLIFDFDSQGSLSNVLKSNANYNEDDSGKWLKRTSSEQDLENTIQQSKINNIYYVHTNSLLNNVRNSLLNTTLRELVLSSNLKLMSNYLIKLGIDYVFFDLNPIFDDIAKNVYIASKTGIIQVVEPHIFSLQGLNVMLSEWKNNTRELGLNDNIQGIILNRIKSNKLSKDFFYFLHEEYGDRILKTFVPDNIGMATSTISLAFSTDIATLNKWKRPKWVLESEYKDYIKDGNPIENLITELQSRNIL
ncbi:ParA family protein [Mycoplasma bovis]|uniref:ParA family protein n=1 Tax=Mycoplasmopsis bovis TaxID=28903 RepID=UPI0019364E46|nr:ParA family protein [Mycoplasmopsis bovis]MBT1421154.1 ParA family protein [Mycoplasmopsis bovis]MCA8840848.1 ParA family protein [Mycoplasmopsis bovis]MCA8841590.1 ParA family protein [Mycoplasmopsis bovis]MCA8842349.1 ParA family protein [Mycoplasmopsis bovis]MCA8844671.1 ParA family protein [Mycoplasmopsis bovis]